MLNSTVGGLFIYTPFICHIAELTELKVYKLTINTTTIETIKKSLIIIYIFSYLLANEKRNLNAGSSNNSYQRKQYLYWKPDAQTLRS